MTPFRRLVPVDSPEQNKLCCFDRQAALSKCFVNPEDRLHILFDKKVVA